MLLVPHRNPRRLIWGDQRALIQHKSDIERSKDKLFFIKHVAAGSTQYKWYLVQVYMDQSYLIYMRDYRIYRCRWYIRHHEDFTQHHTIRFSFWMEISEMKQDGTLGKILPVRPLRVNGLLQR